MCSRRGAVSAVVELLGEVAASGLPYCLEVRDGDAAVEMVARSRGMAEGDRVPLMVLDAVSYDLPDPSPAVRALAPGEDDLHLDLVGEGFEVPPALFEPFRGGRLLDRPEVRAYVADDDGRPVATALGLTSGDYVGVFNVATAPGSRGRGLGAALTARAVADGFDAGARTAVLQSSPQGLSVYTRMGFRTVEQWTVWACEAGS
jgi:ribosomal protein S18 acetylase RimI-like enzyme